MYYAFEFESDSQLYPWFFNFHFHSPFHSSEAQWPFQYALYKKPETEEGITEMA